MEELRDARRRHLPVPVNMITGPSRSADIEQTTDPRRQGAPAACDPVGSVDGRTASHVPAHPRNRVGKLQFRWTPFEDRQCGEVRGA